MMQAGYAGTYRKNTLEKSLKLYDKMVEEDKEGINPFNRHKNWQVSERRKHNRKKQLQNLYRPLAKEDLVLYFL